MNMISCNEQTPNYPSGFELMSAYDSDGDGYISKTDAASAVTDFRRGALTQEEAVLINDAYLSEMSISELCPTSNLTTASVVIGLLGAAVLYGLYKKKMI